MLYATVLRYEWASELDKEPWVRECPKYVPDLTGLEKKSQNGFVVIYRGVQDMVGMPNGRRKVRASSFSYREWFVMEDLCMGVF